MAQTLFDKIKSKIRDYQNDNISNRRYLHMYPEIGFDTKETEKFVRNQLQSYGIEILESKLGVLGRIKGRDSNCMVAFRADLDALPIQEENDVTYRSKVPNVMHACGHDAHTAILLGAARILNELRTELPVDILLIFQPAEEGPNLGGARIIQADLDDQGITEKIKYIFGLHVFNHYEVGKVGIKNGNLMSSTDEFDIDIIGRGGHAGEPHKTVDAISIASKVINLMESFMSKGIDPFDNAVCSFGMIRGGSAKNIVSETATLSGTIRCQKESTREDILERLKDVTNHLCEIYGAENNTRILRGLPVLVNDEKATDYAREALKKDLEYDIFEIPQATMGAEDFAYYAKKIPASFLHLGSRNEDKGFINSAHQSTFDIDEDVIDIGIEVFCSLALHIK